MKSEPTATNSPSLKKPAARQKSDRAATAGSDRVLIASIDSFPASDPPGWIEGEAHPSKDVPPIRRRR